MWSRSAGALIEIRAPATAISWYRALTALFGFLADHLVQAHDRRWWVPAPTPAPKKVQVKALQTGRAFLYPENHPYTNPYKSTAADTQRRITWTCAGYEA